MRIQISIITNKIRHLETIKQLKMDIEEYKVKTIEYDKLIDILNYFFSKMNTYYNKHRE